MTTHAAPRRVRRMTLCLIIALGAVGGMVSTGATPVHATSSTAYGYTGTEQIYTVPAGVTSVTITASGGAGGESPFCADGGYGAKVTATVAVTPNQVLYVDVGSAGGIGIAGHTGPLVTGGVSCGGGGGGASLVQTCPILSASCAANYWSANPALEPRLVVAGGGGGADACSGGDAGGNGVGSGLGIGNASCQGGGGGGNGNGSAGGWISSSADAGGGATQGGPGTGGGGSGQGMVGGNGGGGGGGGGGYYGGGGGAHGAGGGAGSSWAKPGSSGISYADDTARTPLVTISPASATSPVPPFGYTGTEQTYTVPAGVTSVTVTASGGAGSDAAGCGPGFSGFGAKVTATVAVTPNEVLYVDVGSAGNATGAGGNTGPLVTGGAGLFCRGGGGASTVQTCSILSASCTANYWSANPALEPRLVVAGGGGGGFFCSGGDAGGPGVGSGRGLGSGACQGGGGGGNGNGSAGAWENSSTNAGGGATQIGPGTAGGAPGHGMVGGNGGGGGGYYGGGGGSVDGGGGAGSSWAATTAIHVSYANDTTRTPIVMITPTNDLSLTGGQSITATENVPFTGTIGSLTDPDDTPGTNDLSLSVNWGDGSTSACSGAACFLNTSAVHLTSCTTSGSASACNIYGMHTYTAERSSPITITITGSDSTTQPAQVTSSATISPGPDDTTLTPGSTWTAAEGTLHTQVLGHWSDADAASEPPDTVFAAAFPDGHIDYCSTYPSSLPSCFSPSSTLQLVSCNGTDTSCDVQATHTTAQESQPGTGPIDLFATDPDQTSPTLLVGIPVSISPGADDTTLAAGSTWTATEGTAHTQVLGHWSDVDGGTPEPADATFAAAWPDGHIDFCSTYPSSSPSCFSPSSALQLINCNAGQTSCDVQDTHTTIEESEPGAGPIQLFVTDPDQMSPTLLVGIPMSISDAPLSATGGNALTGPSNASCSQFALCSGLVGSFTDTSPSCTAEGEGIGPTTGAPHYAITINWGDGSAATAPTAVSQTAACSYAISGSHSYAAPGSYTVTVTITDEGCADGGTGCSITIGGSGSSITNKVTVSTPASSSNLTGHTTISASPAGLGPSFGFKAANTTTPPGLTGMLYYQDNSIPFFINAFGASGAALPPGIAGSPSWCSSTGGPGCILVIDAIQCSSTLATVYGHYTTVANGQSYYFRVQVTPATVTGPGSFQLTTNSPVGMEVSASLPAVTTILC